jgi:pimeloyl-ACP methyl ester carboxylesterase
MEFQIKEQGNFKYIEEGEGPNLVLLHGLFGALSNWDVVINEFRNNYKIFIPMLPIYDLPFRKVGLDALVDHLEGFIDMKKLDDILLMGQLPGRPRGTDIYTSMPAESKKADTHWQLRLI